MKSKPHGGDAGTAGYERPSAETFEDGIELLRPRLSAYLSAQAGTTVIVEDIVKFPVGFSWITYGVRVSGYPQARDLILRLGPPYGLFAPYSAMPELQSLTALQASSVPAPRAFSGSDDISILGAPFFLCERVDGDAPLPWGGQDSAALEGARRESLAARFHRRACGASYDSIGARRPSRIGAKAVTPDNAARAPDRYCGASAFNAGRCGRIRWPIAPSPG